MGWFKIGDAPKVRFTVTNLELDPPDVDDPATVVLRVKPPTGDELTYTYGVGDTITRVSTGVYTARIPLTEAGRWCVRWNGSGGVAAVAEGYIDVDESEFTDP